MHDARARARSHIVATVDAFPDEQHLTGQVRVVGARAGARLGQPKPLTAVGPHRGRHDPGRARQRRHRCRVRRISHQQRPGRRSTAEPRPDVGEPLRRPSREPDADPVRRMTGQIASYQPPDESGGAEHHHIQLTVSAHQLILKTPAPAIPGLSSRRRGFTGAGTTNEVAAGIPASGPGHPLQGRRTGGSRQ
jgi:hypothetical protein